jgi:hypothetical protein
MTKWKLNGIILDIAPTQVNYILISGAIRSTFVYSKVAMPGGISDQFGYKPEFPVYTMTWQRVSDLVPSHGGDEALYKTLSELPLNKNIIMKDGSYGIDNIEIQVLNRKIDYVRTNPNNEIITSVTLTIRFM